jgi:hypothetical protein
MDNLVFNCTDALLQPDIPLCAEDYGERIVSFAVMKKGGTFTVAGSDNPTAAEFQTAINAGQLAFYTGISNGHRISQGGTTLSGDDTVTGGEENYDMVDRIEGRLKLIDESVKRGTEKLTRYSQLRVWAFTDKNWVYGGATGYLASPNFGTVVHEGKGQPPYIPFHFDYVVVGLDNAKYDADYATLTT